MTPAKGQNVQLFLRYNISVEGTVREWNENQIVLTSGIHHLVIYNPKEDLIMAKIMGKSRLSGIIPPAQSISAPIETATNAIEVIDKLIESDYTMEALEDDIAETIASPSGNSLRIKKLATLRGMLASAEKEVVAGKLTSHQMQPIAKVEYASPVQLFKRNS
jgi:hypothetical protein